jgi:hypothetical protein
LRKDATQEQRVAGFMRCIEDLVGPGLTLQRVPMEREVVVVRGTLRYTEPLGDREAFPTLHLFRGARRPATGFNGSVGQTTRETLQIVGEVLGRPMVIDGADLGADGPNLVTMYERADLRRTPQRADAALADEILANLAKQTSLQFTRERREVPTWRLTPAN